MSEKDTERGYLRNSDKIAKKSKDPSTKVGAIITDKDNISVISFGYNGMPRGLDDYNEERNQRPEKYFWYEHAERNAIYNSAREILEGSIIFTSHFPNMESARAIVSAGISKVIVDKDLGYKNHAISMDIASEFERVKQLFKETNVLIEYIDSEIVDQYLNNDEALNLAIEKDPNLKKMIKHAGYLDIAKDFGLEHAQDNKWKVGALILNPKTLAPIASGFRGLAHNFEDLNRDNFTDKEKIFFYEEAEKTAIFNAIRPKFEGANIYVSWCPCCHCARAVASVGIKKVITRQPDFTQEADKRWEEHFHNSIDFLSKTNVKLILINEPTVK